MNTTTQALTGTGLLLIGLGLLIAGSNPINGLFLVGILPLIIGAALLATLADSYTHHGRRTQRMDEEDDRTWSHH